MPHFQVSRTTGFVFGTDTIAVSPWSHLGLLMLRLHTGLSMASAGRDKIPVPDWFVGQVSEAGFPAPAYFAFVAALSEFAGGILLAMGLFTRPAALFLTFTIGVAAFGFHKVLPVIDLHIAQALFWSYIMILCTGGGRYALDRWIVPVTRPVATLSSPGHGNPDSVVGIRRVLIGTAIAAIVVGLGVYGQFRPSAAPPRADAARQAIEDISTLSVAGTFNNWDLNAAPMSLTRSGRWIATVRLPKPGPVEFKFAANGSWDLNCGDGDQESDSLPLAGVGQVNDGTEPPNVRAFIPMAGDYTFSIRPADLAYSVEKAAKPSGLDPAAADSTTDAR